MIRKKVKCLFILINLGQGGSLVSLRASHRYDPMSICEYMWVELLLGLNLTPRVFLLTQNRLSSNINWLCCCAPWSSMVCIAAARGAFIHAFGPTDFESRVLTAVARLQ